MKLMLICPPLPGRWSAIRIIAPRFAIILIALQREYYKFKVSRAMGTGGFPAEASSPARLKPLVLPG
jgi:hypothetical protein